MTALEIIVLILSCGISSSLVLGLISAEGNNNTFENLYGKYIENKTERMKLELEMMKETTKQIREKTKQMDIGIAHPFDFKEFKEWQKNQD